MRPRPACPCPARTSPSRAVGPAALLVSLLVGAVVPALTPSPLAAQVVTEQSVVGTALELRGLEQVKRVLMIGAHPDDEDTALLTALARGMGAETAYLSLTRGDGGQNLIGPELGEGLGVIRTGELLAARELDGGVQYFTRAYDFGYSKTADEALRLWPREELLRDVVWVIRSFRPHVIVSVFSGTPADGHGQHQASGIIAREAFEAAADPLRFRDLPAGPWQADKLYRRPRGDEPTHGVETGSWDPLLGRSHFQLAMESRSQHRSQDMGMAQPIGGRTTGLLLWDTAPDVSPEVAGQGFFDGVGTALTAGVDNLPDGPAGRVRSGVSAYLEALAEARADLNPVEPWAVVPPLTRGLAALRSAAEVAASAAPGSELARNLEERVARVSRVTARAAGLDLRVRVEDDLVIPGQTVAVTVELWNGGPYRLAPALGELETPSGWRRRPVVVEAGDDAFSRFFGRRAGNASGNQLGPDGSLAPGAVGRWRWEVTIPEDAELSRLYYRKEDRDGEMYRWPDEPESWGRPGNPPVISGAIAAALEVEGVATPVELERPGRYVGVDKATGQFERPVLVVPAVSVTPETSSLVWPRGLAPEREVRVRVRGFAPDGAAGRVALEAPPGWSVSGPEPFRLDGPGTGTTVRFTVRNEDAVPGRHTLRAVARLTRPDGREVDQSVTLIDYPHIQRTAMFDPAEIDISLFPVAVDDVAVGYLMGSGDDGLLALRQMGVDAREVTPAEIADGVPDDLDVLVLGIRVYETRPEAAAVNDRILDFARAGGTVIVQYNKYEYPAGGFAPYEVSMGRPAPRVTDETSPVRILDTAHPVVSEPNRITEADFQGWVQERGLYFLRDWDRRFEPVLAFTDPGEEPALGSLLIAPVGEGLYVYTGISFFRQFPAGVAGAYRLFANLVSLQAEDLR